MLQTISLVILLKTGASFCTYLATTLHGTV